MEFREIRSLTTLAELGSISLAADRLHLSPAAIHKQLKMLEAELEVRLYEKVGRRLQLTQAADLLLPYFREVLAQRDYAWMALQEWKGLKRGLLRVGTGPSSYVLPALLKQFRKKHPGVEVFVETGNTPVLLDGLVKGSLDLALIVSPDLTESGNICVEASWEFEMVLVSHSRQVPRRPNLSDLRTSRFILFRQGSRMQQAIDRYFAAHGFEPKVAMRLDNSEFIRTMAHAGLGLGLLPLWVVERDVRQGSLHIIRVVEPPLYSKIALVRRKSSYLPQPAQALIAVARDLDSRKLRLLTDRPAGRSR